MGHVPPREPFPLSNFVSREESEEQRAELDELCRRRGRPLSFQVEHMLALSKLLIEFCDGNDDLEAARERLAAAKKCLARKTR